jgi:hypothetical protein
MAKGKHAVALFEVISKDKRFARSRRASGTGSVRAARTAGWSRLTQWFRKRAEEPFVSNLSPMPAGVVESSRQSTPVAPAEAEAAPMTARPEAAVSVAPEPEPFQPRSRMQYVADAPEGYLSPGPTMASEARVPIALPKPPVWDPTAEPIRLRSDVSASDSPASSPTTGSRFNEPTAADRHEPDRHASQQDKGHLHAQPHPFAPLAPGRPHKTITIPLTPASVGIIGAAAAVLVIGVILTRQPRQAAGVALTATTADQIRRGPAHPEVLNVRESAPASGAPAAKQAGPAAAPGGAAGNPAPSTAVTNAKRQVNLNYVLIQSYADEKQASEACAFLNANGVPCSIEQNIKGWRSDWYLVVGTTGFPRISTPDFTEYLNRIDAASRKFTNNPKGFKAFKPQALKWDKP